MSPLFVTKSLLFYSGADKLPVLRVGEQDELRLSITVRNDGEDAHEASLTVLLPKSLPFMNSEVRLKMS